MKIFCRLALLLLVSTGLFLASSLEAKSLEKRLEAHLFSPDQLKEHRHALGLTDAQVQTISKAIGAAEGKLTELQWKLEDASQELVDAVAQDQPEESIVLSKAEEVLAMENQVKIQHLKLLLKIKKSLTPKQLDQLRQLPR